MVATTATNPFAAALAGGSVNPEMNNRSGDMSPFARALQDNRRSEGDSTFARTFGNLGTNLDLENKQIGFDSPELKKQHEADLEQTRQHMARLAAEREQHEIFNAAEAKTKQTIKELRAHFLQVALPEARIQMKTAAADALLTDNMPVSLDGAKGTLSYWQKMILKAGQINLLAQSVNDSGTCNDMFNAKKAKMGPGAAIKGTHGYNTTTAVHKSSHHELTIGE